MLNSPGAGRSSQRIHLHDLFVTRSYCHQKAAAALKHPRVFLPNEDIHAPLACFRNDHRIGRTAFRLRLLSRWTLWSRLRPSTAEWRLWPTASGRGLWSAAGRRRGKRPTAIRRRGIRSAGRRLRSAAQWRRHGRPAAQAARPALVRTSSTQMREAAADDARRPAAG
jgi:uncharacterized Zn-finger protein